MRGTPTTFWGKLHRVGDEGPVLAWHPLEHHCADVAAVAEALLNHTLLGKRLAHLAGLPALDAVTRARLCVLVALHDLGKFNHEFQNKAFPGRGPTGGHVSPPLELLQGIGPLSREFEAALPAEMGGWSELPETLWALLDASIGHHGRPVAPAPILDAGVHARRWRPAHGLDPLGGVAALTQRVRTWFPAAWSVSRASLPGSAAFQHAFAGLVMLADWLGSDTDFFPYGDPSEERIDFARRQARAALRAVGLDPVPVRNALGAEPPDYARLFSDPARAPHAMQRAVHALPVVPEGELVVLESETGSGKTEAAFMRFLVLFHAGLVDGMYFALPTRTAATQLYERVRSYSDRLFGSDVVQVVQAVPGYLGAGGAEARRLPGFEVLWNDHPSERVRHLRWAAEQTKRYLAGTIVVGTIDQVLLSGLQVSHAHMRSTALLRLLLVVDEVHASDTYMTQLLVAVLAQHRAAGGHALLMSATLGSEARALLLGERERPSLEEAVRRDYPLVVQARRKGPLHPVPIADAGLPKCVTCRVEPWSANPERIVETAQKAAERGLRVLIVRNTVADAVATQRVLERALPRDSPLLLRCAGVPVAHHARFARDDRTLLDRVLEARVGKETPAGGCVIVATQTVQQSLDIDVDLLLTDLCPMDVLLQRIGRVWRHPARTRKLVGQQGAVVVLRPEERDLGVLLDPRGILRGKHGIGSVYPDLRVLEATLQAVEANPKLSIPTMNRALVEAATHPEALTALAKAKGERWIAHGHTVQGAGLGQKSVANENSLPWTQPFVDESGRWWGFPTGEQMRRMPTRLGESDRRVELGRRITSPLGSTLDELTIPGWMARGVGEEATVDGLTEDRGTVRFEWGGRCWLYDRLGLRKDEGEEDGGDD